MNLNEISKHVTQEIRSVNKLTKDSLQSSIPLINDIGTYVANSGGKKIRPLLIILLSRALNSYTDKTNLFSIIIEFIHTATLLHDDVIDKSMLRRGIKTSNNIWGDTASILTGDFLYSRSFQLMLQIENNQILKLVADTTNNIAEGEMLQLSNQRNPHLTEDQYFKIIEAKTAKLFSAAAHGTAILANHKTQNLSAFGTNFGIAYQLIDDASDYKSALEQLGKNIGDDLKEGKSTLPLIHAIQNGDYNQKQTIIDAIKNASVEKLPDIVNILQSVKSIEYTINKARHYIDQAKLILNGLSVNEKNQQYRDALINLCDYLVLSKFGNFC